MNKIFLTFFTLFGVFGFMQGAMASSDAAIVGLAFLLPMLVIGLFFAAMIALTVFWILMIIDAAKNEKDNDLVAWIVILVFLQCLGAVIYYFVRKRPRDRGHTQSISNQS
jgi:prolipoprotein diacylglyceryltransferase